MPKRNNHGTETGTETESTQDKIVEIVQKRKPKNGLEVMKDFGAEPGENARFIRFALASWDLPPIDISDPNQVKERIGMYFKHCADNDRKPQIVGMCNWLGISRQALNEWKNGVTRSETHGDIIKKAYGVMEEMWADFMLYGKVSPPTGIFLSKNWFNYKDVADVVVTPNNPYQAASDEELSKKYLTDMVTDEE